VCRYDGTGGPVPAVRNRRCQNNVALMAQHVGQALVQPPTRNLSRNAPAAAAWVSPFGWSPAPPGRRKRCRLRMTPTRMPRSLHPLEGKAAGGRLRAAIVEYTWIIDASVFDAGGETLRRSAALAKAVSVTLEPSKNQNGFLVTTAVEI